MASGLSLSDLTVVLRFLYPVIEFMLLLGLSFNPQ